MLTVAAIALILIFARTFADANFRIVELHPEGVWFEYETRYCRSMAFVPTFVLVTPLVAIITYLGCRHLRLSKGKCYFCQCDWPLQTESDAEA
jgi:hypothetical protein